MIALVKSRGVPVIEHLPPLEDDADTRVRPVQEVHRRMRALCVYFMRGQCEMEKVAYADFRAMMDTLKAWGDLSPRETVVVNARVLTPQQVTDSSWSLEAMHALAWSMGLVEELAWPSDMCDMGQMLQIVKSTRPGSALQMRSVGELLDQADLHYRLHWACRQRELDGKEQPQGVETSVVVERRKALEWVILMDGGKGWDGVELST